jgi:CheY-like chemotaxis protein
MSAPGRSRGLSGLLARADIPKVPQTLLLADDSVTIQRVIELTFADEDIDVVAVSDGDQAIARLDAIPPDIVLVDVGMPGKSGYEVAAYVKQSPRLSHIPVVLLTGAFEPVDEARAAGVGCDGVLAKPFEPQLVIGRVKELLNASSRGPIGSDARAFGVSPAAVEAPREDEATSIDDYFDQLDAAFSNLSGKPAQPAGPVASPEIDWFGLKHGSSASIAEPELKTHEPAPEPTTRQAAPQPEPVRPRAVPPMPTSAPPLADEFAALLDAEQARPPSAALESSPAPAAVVPAPVAAPASAPPAVPVAVTDDLVAQVSARVLLQLSDRVVREAVAEIAERLIREEIERIKASIQ